MTESAGKEDENVTDVEAEKTAAELNNTPDNKKQKGKSGLMSFIAIVAVINLVLTSGLLLLYDRFMAQKVVAVDMKGFIEEQRDLYITKKINDEQLKANLDAMENKIKSMPKNKIMISADVLVGSNAEVARP